MFAPFLKKEGMPMLKDPIQIPLLIASSALSSILNQPGG